MLKVKVSETLAKSGIVRVVAPTVCEVRAMLVACPFVIISGMAAEVDTAVKDGEFPVPNPRFVLAVAAFAKSERLFAASRSPAEPPAFSKYLQLEFSVLHFRFQVPKPYCRYQIFFPFFIPLRFQPYSKPIKYCIIC